MDNTFTNGCTKALVLPKSNPMANIAKAALLTATVALVWVLTTTVAWANGNQIIGSWLTTEDKAVVEIYRDGDQYFGKFTFLKEPNYAAGHEAGLDGQAKVDRNNPDASQHKQPIIGLVMLSGMNYNGEKKGKHQWKGGKIYDPGNGKSYKCTINLNADGSLDLRGFIGISLFGRTQVWRPQQ
ncbi:MAG: DUF2147 domain-containing protein [Oceanospirillaceae bacterium]|jgi:uncharacterized protein (DUF2147 family)|nr:DUF2147 domain-containing protein [Oceanospirillaceae bacterium]MBT4441970.1 DUF2147 domain-containing protein [Oceanospirillaceae bacterium]MBT6077185.1 DUF2147 domain-containing protein [Oceanospirillaceae bacterium]